MTIIDSSACSSRFINEDEFHFLLVYPYLCNRPRVPLLNAIGLMAPLTLRTLLYGNDNLDLTVNKRIVIIIIIIIITTTTTTTTITTTTIIIIIIIIIKKINK